jgi:hypothetical protein
MAMPVAGPIVNVGALLQAAAMVARLRPVVSEPDATERRVNGASSAATSSRGDRDTHGALLKRLHEARPRVRHIARALTPVREVRPGSTALRELLAAIVHTLTLDKSETTTDELTCLRISRDRARLVMLTCRRLLADPEADTTDVMIAVTQLRALDVTS